MYQAPGSRLRLLLSTCAGPGIAARLAGLRRWLRRDGNPEGVTALRLRQFVEGLAIPWELLGLIDPAARESSSQCATLAQPSASGIAGWIPKEPRLPRTRI